MGFSAACQGSWWSWWVWVFGVGSKAARSSREICYSDSCWFPLEIEVTQNRTARFFSQACFEFHQSVKPGLSGVASVKSEAAVEFIVSAATAALTCHKATEFVRCAAGLAFVLVALELQACKNCGRSIGKRVTPGQPWKTCGWLGFLSELSKSMSPWVLFLQQSIGIQVAAVRFWKLMYHQGVWK